MSTINSKSLQRNTVLVLIILAVIALRTWFAGDSDNLAPFANFSPLGAMALFGGAYLIGWRGFAFPILAIWVSDILLNRFFFYGEWVLFYEGAFWTYGAFALMVLVGRFILQNVTVSKFLFSAVTVVLIHWIVTDFGVWMQGTLYPKTAAGFWASLVAAIPFERNFLIGTLAYGAVLFGAFEWLKNRHPVLRREVAAA